MLQLVRTVAIDGHADLALTFYLKRGAAGFVLVRESGSDDGQLLAAAVIGAGYPWRLKLRAKNLRDIRSIDIAAADAAALDLRVEPLTWAWRVADRLSEWIHIGADSLEDMRAGRPGAYAAWHRRYHSLGLPAQRKLLRDLAALGLETGIKVWLVGSEPSALRASRAALAASVVPLPDVAQIASVAEAGRRGAGEAWLHVFVEAGASIEPYAVALLALWLARHPQARLAFADFEALDSRGQIAPVFASAFDPLAARSAPGAQVRGIVALRTGGMPRSGGGDTLESLACDAESAAHHVPAVLCRFPAPQPAARAPSPPRVARGEERISFIVPSRDNAAMLRRAVESLHATAQGFDVEFVVVDHASQLAATATVLRELAQAHPLKVVRAEGAFNFARLINQGRACATGDLLFSVNDDIEADNDRWLPAMVELLRLPDAGCVGPCLLFPDRRIQHAGVVLGMNGLTGHPGRLRRWDDPDLPGLLTRTRQVSALTGAMLGASAAHWDAAGGWNEELAVEFNDIAFCLTMSKAGLRNIYCAASVLIHHESLSRGPPEQSPLWPQIQSDRNRFIAAHWRDLLRDPWYPANLTLRNDSLDLAKPPRRLPLAELAEGG